MLENQSQNNQPSWLGFHRNGLLAVLLLDSLWMCIEVSAGMTIIGIPAIPFIAFILFGLASWIVYKNQRSLGDSFFQATWKAVVLGAIAGVPLSVLFTLLFLLFAGINKLLPNTRGIGIKLPEGHHSTAGKFAEDFSQLEELLSMAANKINAQRMDDTVFENIRLLKKSRVIDKEMYKSLDEIRKARNRIHPPFQAPNVKHQRLLRKLREEMEVIVKDL